jgi:hypothetical protein
VSVLENACKVSRLSAMGRVSWIPAPDFLLKELCDVAIVHVDDLRHVCGYEFPGLRVYKEVSIKIGPLRVISACSGQTWQCNRFSSNALVRDMIATLLRALEGVRGRAAAYTANG